MKPSAVRIAALWRVGGAKGVSDLPPDTYVAVDIMGDEIRVFFSDAEGEELEGSIQGSVEVYDPGSDTGPCLNAFVVGRAFVARGWGPMLYDVAMEAAGKRGLTPDRKLVSSDAERVWRYYMTNRSDVSTKQLDWSPGASKHLTPNPKDDCLQTSMRSHDPEDADLLASPLSKVYYARGTPTISTLQRAGRLIRL